MKTLASFVGLIGAITIAPLALQAQQFIPASNASSYGGPSHFESNEQVVAPCHSIPYGYLWNGYCEENARHYACRMQHAMNAAAAASNAAGACPAEKFHIMKETLSERLNPFGSCGHCENCRGTKASCCSSCKYAHEHGVAADKEPAQLSQPEISDSARSGSVRPTQEPVFLTPVEPSRQPAESEQPVTRWSPRSPVVRMAPAAPQPPSAKPPEVQPEQREQRIPRNIVPPRPANPRSAAIPVNTNLSTSRITRQN
jgi:hypothetical protein